jgi:MFS superfamily sulfate permease-like transporter
MKSLSIFKPDLLSGFSVALVALPLSIGIALASGAPASAGIIAAVIGGVLGSWLGGAQMTVNGPAAGLIVIVLDAIVSMSFGDPMRGFKGMLAAAVVAGALQVVFGVMKLGRRGSAFPTSVIHGMMAAIGLIIIAKQMHVLVGHPPHAKNPVMLFAEIPEALMDMRPNVFAIGLSSLIFLISLSKVKTFWVKKIPAPLLTIILGSSLAAYFGLPSTGLLKIPTDFSQWIIFPDFSVMTTMAGWKAAITLALVASLETVLSASAVDKLDPQHRKSDLDRDLFSKGVCNMISASIGGLPMIAEIVRSSANVSYGAQSWRSNFVHGVVILTLVLLAPHALSLIPLASLAAILIIVGSRLGSPAHFMHALKIGPDNLVGFVVTLTVTLSVDLLVGIFAGAVAQFAIEIYMGLKFRHLLHPFFVTKESDINADIDIESSLTFSNFMDVKSVIMDELLANKNVTLNLSRCDYVDHNVMEELEELKKVFHEKQLSLSLKLSPKHISLGKEQSSSLKKQLE